MVGAYIVYEGEPCWEGPNEAASFLLKYREEAFDHERLHKDVIVEEEHGVGLSASQEEVALLSDTAQLAMVPFDRAAAGLDNAPQRLYYQGIFGPVAALARDHDLKVRHRLRGNSRERHDQGFRPLVSRDQHAHLRQCASLRSLYVRSKFLRGVVPLTIKCCRGHGPEGVL